MFVSIKVLILWADIEYFFVDLTSAQSLFLFFVFKKVVIIMFIFYKNKQTNKTFKIAFIGSLFFSSVPMKLFHLNIKFRHSC